MSLVMAGASFRAFTQLDYGDYVARVKTYPYCGYFLFLSEEKRQKRAEEKIDCGLQENMIDRPTSRKKKFTFCGKVEKGNSTWVPSLMDLLIFHHYKSATDLS